MKKYQIIYADPPWMETGGGKIKRGADRHYSLMRTKDIISLPVKNITDTNAHLYLWTTNKFLPDALQVVSAWGFKYKTMITWVKDRVGLGQYFRGMTEHCLFAVRGNIPYRIVENKRQQGRTVIIAQRTIHSKKPEELRNMILKVSGDLPRIELFAREKVAGWDVWGNEVKSDIDIFKYGENKYET